MRIPAKQDTAYHDFFNIVRGAKNQYPKHIVRGAKNQYPKHT
jgi:hypothetical protein